MIGREAIESVGSGPEGEKADPAQKGEVKITRREGWTNIRRDLDEGKIVIRERKG